MNKFLIALVMGVLSTPVNASLISVFGGQAVYDTDLDITWLANTNAAKGAGFESPNTQIAAFMTFANANAWAASLNVGGFTGWRLPTTLNDDPTCIDPVTGIPTMDTLGNNCTGSEMGHLFYTELGGVVGSTILDSGDPDLALFNFVEGNFFWSSTEWPIDTTRGYIFDFNVSAGPFCTFGCQTADFKTNNHNGWAVHDGNIGGAVVPAPAAVWLFGSALGLLGWMRQKIIVIVFR